VIQINLKNGAHVCDVHVFSSLLAKGGVALWGTLDIS